MRSANAAQSELIELEWETPSIRTSWLPENRYLTSTPTATASARKYSMPAPTVPTGTVRVAQADLGHQGGDSVLAHRAEAVHLDPALERVQGQLAAEVAVVVAAQRDAPVIAHAGNRIGVEPADGQIAARLVAVAGEGGTGRAAEEGRAGTGGADSRE